jgi:hypothetical protein
MAHADKQARRPSKADVRPDKLQSPTDVAPEGAKGGDKERKEPLPRPLGGGNHTSPTHRGGKGPDR